MLKGKSVNLRLFRESDLDRYVQLSQDVEARGEYFHFSLIPEPVMRKRFQENGFWGEESKTLAIVDPKEDVVLGSVASFKPGYHDSLEIGYILYEQASRGKGLMTEAVKLYTDFLFKANNIYRVQIQVDTPNHASKRVAERAGFVHEATLRHVRILNGEPADMDMYVMTREMWKSRGQAGDG